MRIRRRGLTDCCLPLHLFLPAHTHTHRAPALTAAARLQAIAGPGEPFLHARTFSHLLLSLPSGRFPSLTHTHTLPNFLSVVASFWLSLSVEWVNKRAIARQDKIHSLTQRRRVRHTQEKGDEGEDSHTEKAATPCFTESHSDLSFVAGCACKTPYTSPSLFHGSGVLLPFFSSSCTSSLTHRHNVCLTYWLLW